MSAINCWIRIVGGVAADFPSAVGERVEGGSIGHLHITCRCRLKCKTNGRVLARYYRWTAAVRDTKPAMIIDGGVEWVPQAVAITGSTLRANGEGEASCRDDDRS